MNRPKRPRDPAQLAKLMVDIATGEVEEGKSVEMTDAQKLARSGGLKGGTARAQVLTSDQRSEIARKAAKSRWGQ